MIRTLAQGNDDSAIVMSGFVFSKAHSLNTGQQAQ